MHIRFTFPPPLMLLILILSSASPGRAQGTRGTEGTAPTVQGIHVVTERPFAVRGGVLLLDLEARRHGVGWPTAIPLELGDRRVNARVIWIHALDRHERGLHWTSPNLSLRVRQILPDDDSSSGLGRPLLLAEIPRDAASPVRVLGRVLQPTYIDLPAQHADDTDQADRDLLLDPVVAPNRPDPDSPFEYWRWVLLAERLRRTPPPPPGDVVSRLIARYHADLWRIGLNRLRALSPNAAEACLDLLTATCIDGEREIAAWLTDPDSLQYLLDVLLDPSRNDMQLAREALDWADTRETLFFWVERDHGEEVELAMANPLPIGRRVRFRWVHDEARSDREEVPIMVELAPRRITRIMITRPALRHGAITLPGTAQTDPQLFVESDGFRRRFNVRPPRHAARPPAFNFGALFPTLTLSDAQSFRIRPPSQAFITSAELRRRGGRWEVFFECFRPGGAPAHRSHESEHLLRLASHHDIPGHEAVTIFIGPEQDPGIIVSIPEIGRHRIWRSPDNATSLTFERASHSDRWWCAVALPDSWIGYPFDDLTMIGVVRTHGEDRHVDAAPNPALPWRLDPGRAAINLHGWLDLPALPGR